jgi:hypothetical protein
MDQPMSSLRVDLIMDHRRSLRPGFIADREGAFGWRLPQADSLNRRRRGASLKGA